MSREKRTAEEDSGEESASRKKQKKTEVTRKTDVGTWIAEIPDLNGDRGTIIEGITKTIGSTVDDLCTYETLDELKTALKEDAKVSIGADRNRIVKDLRRFNPSWPRETYVPLSPTTRHSTVELIIVVVHRRRPKVFFVWAATVEPFNSAVVVDTLPRRSFFFILIFSPMTPALVVVRVVRLPRSFSLFYEN